MSQKLSESPVWLHRSWKETAQNVEAYRAAPEEQKPKRAMMIGLHTMLHTELQDLEKYLGLFRDERTQIFADVRKYDPRTSP